MRVTSEAETLGVNLLDGLITADAVRTTASTTGTGSEETSTSFSGGTEFVNLKIVGVKLPVDIPHNYNATIPDVARVSINGLISGEKDGGRGTARSRSTPVPPRRCARRTRAATGRH